MKKRKQRIHNKIFQSVSQGFKDACVSIINLVLMRKSISKSCVLCFSKCIRHGSKTISSGKGFLATKPRLCLVPDSLHPSDLSCLLESSSLGFDRRNGHCLLMVRQSNICLKLMAGNALEHTKYTISNCYD